MLEQLIKDCIAACKAALKKCETLSSDCKANLTVCITACEQLQADPGATACCCEECYEAASSLMGCKDDCCKAEDCLQVLKCRHKPPQDQAAAPAGRTKKPAANTTAGSNREKRGEWAALNMPPL